MCHSLLSSVASLPWQAKFGDRFLSLPESTVIIFKHLDSKPFQNIKQIIRKRISHFRIKFVILCEPIFKPNMIHDSDSIEYSSLSDMVGNFEMCTSQTQFPTEYCRRLLIIFELYFCSGQTNLRCTAFGFCYIAYFYGLESSN